MLTKPIVTISNKMYQLDPYCSVVVEELGDRMCDAISPTESEPEDTSYGFTTLEVASVVIMAVLVMFILTACVIITVYCIVKRSRVRGKIKLR